MSAIRKLIAEAKALNPGNSLVEEVASAAEAELKDLASIAARPLRDEIRRLRERLAHETKRDQAHAERDQTIKSQRAQIAPHASELQDWRADRKARDRADAELQEARRRWLVSASRDFDTPASIQRDLSLDEAFERWAAKGGGK